MKALILAGGRGTRLWPLSRTKYPKQFLKVGGEESLLQKTARRILHMVAPHDVVVLTNAEYQFHVLSDLRELLGEKLPERLVLEPCSRNTGPALGLAALFCLERLGCDSSEVLFVAPSDHLIRPDEEFASAMRTAANLASAGCIVTFGIRPAAPSTAYGYIKAGAPYHGGGLRVERFTEKPDAETAARFLAEGGYYWNSGMFAFRADVLLDELRRHAPPIAGVLDTGYAAALARFETMPNISIDYAVMEHSDRVVTLLADIEWSDVGSWDAFFTMRDADTSGNVTIGNVVARHTRQSLFISEKRLLAAIGVKDVLVVATDDAVLVAPREDAEQVKDLVAELAAGHRVEVDEHLTTYRPWGQYTVLGEGPRYKIKRVVVQPGEQLSLQMHHHRSEHWVVVRGTAQVTVGEKTFLLHENESTYIPKSTRHRLGNPGKVPLEIIEVQNGEYVGEDDIVRFDDQYGRENS